MVHKSLKRNNNALRVMPAKKKDTLKEKKTFITIIGVVTAFVTKLSYIEPG